MSILDIFKKTKPTETKPSTKQNIVINSQENINQSAWSNVGVVFSDVGSNGSRWDYIDRMANDDMISSNKNFIDNNILALIRDFSGKNAEQVKFAKKCFENIGFNKYISDLLKAQFNGFSLFEPVFKIENLKYELDKMILIESNTVNFETNKFAQLEKISVGGLYYALNKFWLFTHKPTTKNKYYGSSDLEPIFREWSVKNALKDLLLIGAQHYTMPLNIISYLENKYPDNSKEKKALNGLLDFTSGSRFLLPASAGTDNKGLVKQIELEKMEFDPKGLEFLQSIIDKENEAIKRNMGVPAEYENTANGSNAKMITIDKMFGRVLSSMALPVQDNVQELTDYFCAINFEGYIPGDVVFSFDFNTDRGMTYEKAKTLKMILDSGVVLTDEKKANFLDIDISDIVEKQVDPSIPESVETFETKPKVKTLPKPNLKRIKKRLDLIKDLGVEKISDNINKQTTKANKKIQKYIDDVKLVETAFGDLNMKNRRVFAEILFASYFAGKDEAISELEKQGYSETETFETKNKIEIFEYNKIKENEKNLYNNTIKKMYGIDKVRDSDIEIFECANEIETFEVGITKDAKYVQGNWIKDWLARHNIKLNKMDKVWIKHISDFAYTLSQDINSMITKIYRDIITTQMGLKTNTEIVSAINAKIDNMGLTAINPHHLKTAVNTASSTYFNNARQSLFLDDNLVNSGFIKALEYTVVKGDKTSDYCVEHDGMIINISDPALADNTPPNHPNCRSIFVPISKYYYDNKAVNWKSSIAPAKGYGGGQ